jgi:uncharacterized membrane protein
MNKKYILSVILLIALFLRLFQLGKDSLWFDEAGVVVAAIALTINETLDIAKSHVSAMPLNYLQTRFLLLFSNDETWLRFPSALWGTLAVYALYLLATQITNASTSLIATFLFSLHPLHIYYSQELRFYASGTFFYLFGTYLLLRATKLKNPFLWFLSVFVILLGSYDHPFTIFAWLNVFLIYTVNQKINFKDKNFYFLIISGLIIGLGFLPGYLSFGIEKPLGYEISSMNIVENILIGMGWVPNFDIYHISSTWLGILLFFCFTFGLLITIRRKNKKLIPLLLSIFIQIFFVLVINLKLEYIISARQFLNFLPISLLISSISISTILTQDQPIKILRKNLNEVKQLNFKKINQFIGSIFLIILIFLHIPVLQDYYRSARSYAREITQVLKYVIEPDDKILIYPEYEPLLFNYYFKKEKISFSEDQLVGIDLGNLADFGKSGINQYLIVRTLLNEDQKLEIKENGYSLIWDRYWQDQRAHRVYIKQ